MGARLDESNIAEAAMFHGTSRFEGLKALLSVAAIAAGLTLSRVAASDTVPPMDAPADVVGVWQWVSQDEGHAHSVSGPLFEIRRAADGQLTGFISVGSGDHAYGAEVSVDGVQVCMVTEGGASFSGQLSEDGLRIRGVIHYGSERSSAVLQRVERRKLRRAAERKVYAA
jgi:hypothetical protein